MKEREKSILKYIIIKDSVKFSELLFKFKISRRSIYYDISNINYEISDYGKIVTSGGSVTYVGRPIDFLDKKENVGIEKDIREKALIYLILTEKFTNINEISENFQISRNTTVSAISSIKQVLEDMGLQLSFKTKYIISGDEIKLRNLFVLLDQYSFANKMDVSEEVREFGKINKLKLSDYSKNSLSHLVEFCKKRIAGGNHLDSYEFSELSHEFLGADMLLATQNANELAYISAYILTLSNSKASDVDMTAVKREIEILVDSFEKTTCKTIESKEEFSLNLEQHIVASYHRKKYNFPIYNPLMEDIKSKYQSLFSIIKSIIKKENFHFASSRDEEIAYIVAYFGGYIYNLQHSKINIVLVCPNGLVISNTLRVQLERFISNISIIKVMSLQEFKESKFQYDYVISTINLDIDNFILVNPLLTERDITNIKNKFSTYSMISSESNLENIMEIVEKHCEVRNMKALQNDLRIFFNSKKIKEDEVIMLKDVLTIDKINRIASVEDYKTAIELASEPLIKDGSIEHLYVEEIFKAIEKFGPYVVLADRFALPHASNKAGVSKVGMSILVVDETVDFLGKDVNIFCVLATVDDDSHLQALAELADILYEEENIEKIISGSREEIYDLISGGVK